MGLLFRPRRPVLRLAAGAATAGIAYHAGKQRAGQNAYDDQAGQAEPAPAAPAPAVSAPAAAPVDETGELERLAKLHESGSLTDDEFGAAKARLLGV
jgi:hypothetical protein